MCEFECVCVHACASVCMCVRVLVRACACACVRVSICAYALLTVAKTKEVTRVPSNTRHSVLPSRNWPGSGGSSERVHPCISLLLSIAT